MNTGYYDEQDVPAAIREHQMPENDRRAYIVACSTYPALEGKSEHHSKLTVEDMRDRSQSAVGAPVDHYHADDELVGEVVAAATDKQNRLWVKKAIENTPLGLRTLDMARKNQLTHVSWTMQNKAEIDAEEGPVIRDKKFLRLALTDKPEFPEHTRIHYISDDHPETTRWRKLVGTRDRIDELLEGGKKQKSESTPKSTDKATQTKRATMQESVTDHHHHHHQQQQQQVPPVNTAAPQQAATETDHKTVKRPRDETVAPSSTSVNYYFNTPAPSEKQFDETSKKRALDKELQQKPQQMSQESDDFKKFQQYQEFVEQQKKAEEQRQQRQKEAEEQRRQQEYREQIAREERARIEKEFQDRFAAKAAEPVPAKPQEPATPTTAPPPQQQENTNSGYKLDVESIREQILSDLRKDLEMQVSKGKTEEEALEQRLQQSLPTQAQKPKEVETSDMETDDVPAAKQQQTRVPPSQKEGNDADADIDPDEDVEDKKMLSSGQASEMHKNISSIKQQRDELANAESRFKAVKSEMSPAKRQQLQQHLVEMRAALQDRCEKFVRRAAATERQYHKNVGTKMGDMRRNSYAELVKRGILDDLGLNFIGAGLEFITQSNEVNAQTAEKFEQQLQKMRGDFMKQQMELDEKTDSIQAFNEILGSDPKLGRGGGFKQSDLMSDVVPVAFRPTSANNLPGTPTPAAVFGCGDKYQSEYEKKYGLSIRVLDPSKPPGSGLGEHVSAEERSRVRRQDRPSGGPPVLANGQRVGHIRPLGGWQKRGMDAQMRSAVERAKNDMKNGTGLNMSAQELLGRDNRALNFEPLPGARLRPGTEWQVLPDGLAMSFEAGQ